jgi:signal transduction histidine kinase
MTNSRPSAPDDDASGQVTIKPKKRGVRTHMLLVVTMALVIFVVTGLSLFLIRHQLRAQVAKDLTQDLNHSVDTFQTLQQERVMALERENALLAELPTLKALMTSGDDLTIQNGAAEFWHLSGTDLFLLADPGGRVVAAYGKNAPADAALRQNLKMLLSTPDKQFLIDGGSLYACAVRPIFFGSDEDGTLLGYVVSGVSIERTVRQISEPTGVEAAFFSSGQIVASTLEPGSELALAKQPPNLAGTAQAPVTVMLGNTQYLWAIKDLSATATSPLELVVFKSLEPAERSVNRINRVVLGAGLLALLSGTALMIVVSRAVTRPLEELSKSVTAFGLGDVGHRVPLHGTREVQQLSSAFAEMRGEIQKANQAVLESERLATIGRMASSVSHDLRHYLAAIYANAEFLASDRFSAKDRAEIFAEIRVAVNETTDMIESLLIFSRTGAGTRRQSELMAAIVERSAALLKAHPDAEGVALTTYCQDPAETATLIDGKQMERAISNLMLNACQSARSIGAQARVDVILEVQQEQVTVNVIDNGPGVSEKVREHLFEPFVSEGKQKGTGLGLTLARCIALEHGGDVVLLRSRPGETVFQMKVARESPRYDGMDSKRYAQVIPNEDIRK